MLNCLCIQCVDFSFHYMYTVQLSLLVARVWLFVGFFFAFGALIGGLWIFIQSFLIPGKKFDPPRNEKKLTRPLK